MILAVDVDYRGGKAFAAGVLFQNWIDTEPVKELVVSCVSDEEYVPGRFYRRELPCILSLFERIDAAVDCIVIDGYVYLGKERKAGLGKHLSDSLNKSIAVIGVAKNAFRDTPASTGLLRGKSKKLLYVTAEGIEEDKARHFIKLMHGEHRIPTLLKRVDQLCREAM